MARSMKSDGIALGKEDESPAHAVTPLGFPEPFPPPPCGRRSGSGSANRSATDSTNASMPSRPRPQATQVTFCVADRTEGGNEDAAICLGKPATSAAPFPFLALGLVLSGSNRLPSRRIFHRSAVQDFRFCTVGEIGPDSKVGYAAASKARASPTWTSGSPSTVTSIGCGVSETGMPAVCGR
jgi:hypothetical protein